MNDPECTAETAPEPEKARDSTDRASTAKTVAEFADRYDDWAEDYDEENDCEEIRTCRSLVVEHAAPGPEDTVLDVGTGTGAVALALAGDAGEVIGRDVSEGMLEQARENAADEGVESVTFGVGRFRDPNVERADVVVSNFAMHHLDDRAKREAIETIATLEPRRIVLGEGMYFADSPPAEPFFDPESVYPATVGHLADVLTDAGYAVTAVERVHDQVGVLVGERIPEESSDRSA